MSFLRITKISLFMAFWLQWTLLYQEYDTLVCLSTVFYDKKVCILQSGTHKLQTEWYFSKGFSSYFVPSKCSCVTPHSRIEEKMATWLDQLVYSLDSDFVFLVMATSFNAQYTHDDIIWAPKPLSNGRILSDITGSNSFGYASQTALPLYGFTWVFTF